MAHDSLQFVNRREPIQISGKRLPHWNQSGCVQFVTFRLADSLPQAKLQEYREMKAEWLQTHAKPWSTDTQEEYERIFGAFIDKWIDAGYGECVLKDARVRDVLEQVILRSDGTDCDIYTYVIMPSHVHILMSPKGGQTVQRIVGTWKSVSSHRINTLLGKTGAVWEREIFDRLVRNGGDFNGYVTYISENPRHMPSEWYTLVNKM